jgi:O-antigen/teichoic acid export membrane protein
MILLMPFAVIAALNSHTVLTILFGSIYADYPFATPTFALLVLSYVLWGFVYAMHSMLRSLGESRFFIFSGLAVILIEIIGCWYTISLFGLFGAAIVRACYILLLFLMAWIKLRQHEISKARPAVSSLPRVSLASIVSAIIVFVMAPQDIATFVISVGIALGVYLLLLLVSMEVNKLDFRLAKHILPAKTHRCLDRLEKVFCKDTRKYD